MNIKTNRKRRLLNALLHSGKRKSKKGLTLIEIAMVLMVIAIIIGIVYANIDTGVIGKAQILKVKSSSQTIPILLERYEFENASLEEGASLDILAKKNPENPSYRPAQKDAVKDPWGNYYFICRDDFGVKQICTYGKDNEMGGEDENADFILTDESTWPLWLTGNQNTEEN